MARERHSYSNAIKYVIYQNLNMLFKNYLIALLISITVFTEIHNSQFQILVILE